MGRDVQKNAKVLIISWSPVPTPKYQKIEGSGQRAIGLARGLKQNGIKNIGIAVGNIYPLDVDSVEGIKLHNYDFNDDFKKLINSYDTIIFNYAIHGSLFIKNSVDENKQVIIDAYGPAYIESLARDPEDIVGTYIGNLQAVKEIFNQVLPRGDYFLYANEAQERLYTGVLSTLGVINQFSYKTQRLIHAPFGIDKQEDSIKYENPYAEFGFKGSDFILLWFGGLYPWFDITDILKAIKEDSTETIKLVVVGGNNPQNQHPDFIKNYQKVVKYIDKNGLQNRVVLVEWADFATRRKYYEHADAIISLNGQGKENNYSWRTRVMDYVGSTTPLISNGGDPLSDELIDIGAAFKVAIDKPSAIREKILELSQSPELLRNASKKMKSIQPKYYWESVTAELASLIAAGSRPYSEERLFRLINGLSEDSQPRRFKHIHRFVLLKNKVLSLKRKVSEKGLATSYLIFRNKLRRRLGAELSKRKIVKVKQETPSIVVFSNQFNNTGAPKVLIDLIKEIKSNEKMADYPVRLVTFTPVDVENIKRVESYGVRIDVYTNRDLVWPFGKGDIIIFNTFAFSRSTVLSALNSVKDGVARKLYWYGHEASPEGFLDADVKGHIKHLLAKDKVTIYGTSIQTVKEYRRFFGERRGIYGMPYRFIAPEGSLTKRTTEDFNTISFVNTGSLMDMRKGQFPILYAFLDFYHNFYLKKPENYRDFSISFIGAYDVGDESDSVAYHIKNILKQFRVSSQILGEKVKITPSLSHEKALAEVKKADVTICYSLLEALPIFVYEGMAFGHPIIRNESPGYEEQLRDGVNGLSVQTDDFPGLVCAIEAILNKKKTSNKKLVRMSEASQRIAFDATKNKYHIIRDIESVLMSQ